MRAVVLTRGVPPRNRYSTNTSQSKVGCWWFDGSFWDFPVILLLLISSLIPFWSESRHWVVSIFLNLWRCVSRRRIQSSLVRVPGELGKNAYLLLLDEVVCGCQLYPVDWWRRWVWSAPSWFSPCWIGPFLTNECWSRPLGQQIHLFLLASSTVFASRSLTHCC